MQFFILPFVYETVSSPLQDRLRIQIGRQNFLDDLHYWHWKNFHILLKRSACSNFESSFEVSTDCEKLSDYNFPLEYSLECSSYPFSRIFWKRAYDRSPHYGIFGMRFCPIYFINLFCSFFNLWIYIGLIYDPPGT